MGIFLLVNIIPLGIIGQLIYYSFSDNKFYRSLNIDCKKNYGEGLFLKYGFANWSYIWWPLVSWTAAFFVHKSWEGGLLPTVAIWLLAYPCHEVLDMVEKLKTMSNAREEERNSYRRDKGAYEDFSSSGYQQQSSNYSRRQQSSNNNQSSDDGYNFNSNRWGNKGQAQDPDAPRGYENRHPDDAKFWAHVDDPTNPTHVREMWFKEIMKREKARSEGQNPDHEKDSDDVKRALLGILKKRSN